MGFGMTAGDYIFPFSWYGGKVAHLDFLLPHFPRGPLYHFIDVYGGSAVVVLNADNDYRIKTYNDIHSEIVHFFQVLRDNGRELHRQILLTPYSREEYIQAFSPEPIEDELERARRFFIRTQMSRNGQSMECARVNSTPNWSYNIRETRKQTAIAVNRYQNRARALRKTIEGLLNIQIENLPALKLIEKYDNEYTFFYLDPPYVHGTRSNWYKYDYEMTDDDHRELAEVLQGIEGKAMVSGYKSDLYDEIFKGWNRIEDEPYMSPTSKTVKQECIWLNYQSDARIIRQVEMFGEVSDEKTA